MLLDGCMGAHKASKRWVLTLIFGEGYIGWGWGGGGTDMQRVLAWV